MLALPHRHPVIAAKMLATVDVLSKGRLTVGVGVGWMSEEIALLAGPPFADLAQASDIQAVRELWTAEKPVQQGPCVAFHKLLFAPKSAQLPHAPIWLGGEVEAAPGRASRLANRWYPVAANPRIPLDTPQLYGDALAKVRAEAERPAAILVRLWAQFSPFTGVSEPSSKVAKAAESRSREVSKRSSTISATFMSVGCSIA